MVQELDSSRRIRQCNWVRFLVSTDSCQTQANEDDATRHSEGMEPNMSAMLLDGQPVFEVTKSVLPHTLIVVHFQDTARDGLLAYSYNGIPLGQKYASPTELQGNYNYHFHMLAYSTYGSFKTFCIANTTLRSHSSGDWSPASRC
jgi:hypothetical protein